MIVEVPIPGHLIEEVHALPEFVVTNRILLAGVCKEAIGLVRERNVRQNVHRDLIERLLWNHSIGENALGGSTASGSAVELAALNRIAKALRKDLRPIAAVHGRRIAASIQKSTR